MRSHLLLSSLAVLASASSLLSQTAPCLGLNDANNNVVNLITARNSTHPGEWGWRYTASGSIDVHGMRVFTGNAYTDGFMKLAIWSHDTASNAPGNVLGEGTFAAPKNANKGWVGTNLDAVVKMDSGKTYWIVWTEIGWSTPPFDSGGATLLPAVRRFGAGNGWTAGSPQGLKCRFFCSPIDDQGVTAFGPSCSGVNTGIGTSFTNTAPAVGNTDFRVEGTGLPPGAATFLAVGVVSAWPSISLGGNAPGCFINTDQALILGGRTGTGDVRATDAAGHVRFNLGIPNDPSLRGVFVAFQIATEDAASPNNVPLVLTNATRIVVF